MNNIIKVLIVLLEAQALSVGIIILSFFIETIFGLNLLIDNYIWKKSPKIAENVSSRDSFFYLIINAAVYGYNIYHGKLQFKILGFLFWLVLVSVLVKVFYMIHLKYQAVDPNKADDDYT